MAGECATCASATGWASWTICPVLSLPSGSRKSVATQALTRRGLLLGVFTRNSRECASLTLSRLGIPCDDLVAREDAAPKPDPGGLNMLASRWGLAAGDILMVGDFRYDIESGRAAGMQTCLYDPAGDNPAATLADCVVSHFEELEGLLDRD